MEKLESPQRDSNPGPLDSFSDAQPLEPPLFLGILHTNYLCNFLPHEKCTKEIQKQALLTYHILLLSVRSPVVTSRSSLQLFLRSLMINIVLNGNILEKRIKTFDAIEGSRLLQFNDK